MPRGRKCQARAREKRRQARQEPQNLVSAQTTTRSNEGANYQVEQRSRSSQALSTMEFLHRSRLKEKVILLVYYLLYKYQIKEPITKGEMVRNVIQIYRNHFLEILKRASDHMEMVFGLNMKELDPYRHVYILVNKLEPCCDTVLNDDGGVPKTGLLMTILGVIYMNHNCATEEQVWETLNVMGLYQGRSHFLFGEPKKLITEDLVKEDYLVYCQVPHSHPPHHEFMWGPRAHIETTKMKVLEFLAKVHGTDPTTFPLLYEEALKDEEERAQARAAVRACRAAMARECSRAKEAAPPTPNQV
ncbi:melanoma-associated antigen B10-like [Phyllostomus discolor]|uniref:Melanoma-associated antigen B10-like n=1 Tax=Phyllostomus discolor TaxID=89673 RepID=A0A6J2MID2_9CHIR|nr:melanoma-associated antigen B10-like [Phyllostomus discolor]